MLWLDFQQRMARAIRLQAGPIVRTRTALFRRLPVWVQAIQLPKVERKPLLRRGISCISHYSMHHQPFRDVTFGEQADKATVAKDGKRAAMDDGVKIPACGKAIYSDDITLVGGTHSGMLKIVGGTKQAEMESKLPALPESKTSTNHMDNFLKAAAGVDPYCNSSFAISGPLTQVFMLGCIAQRLGEDLTFDTVTKQITNNERANALLKGPAPRKGWESYYKMV